MARLRPRGPARLPASLPPEYPRRILEGVPPMGAHTGWQHWHILPDHRKKERSQAAVVRSVDGRCTEALQRSGCARARHHRRVPAQSPQQQSHETPKTETGRIPRPFARSSMTPERRGAWFKGNRGIQVLLALARGGIGALEHTPCASGMEGPLCIRGKHREFGLTARVPAAVATIQHESTFFPLRSLST